MTITKIYFVAIFILISTSMQAMHENEKPNPKETFFSNMTIENNYHKKHSIADLETDDEFKKRPEKNLKPLSTILCEICHKRFSTKSHRQRHFARSKDDNHKKYVEEKFTYKCSCGRAFENGQGIASHLGRTAESSIIKHKSIPYIINTFGYENTEQGKSYLESATEL